ncbi:MAG: MarR family transcriptional regulator [Candidatus Gastranaerophilales bacterium]|nr:MarR family transcriptional regulator [Candidatus Gastranaerophilales bacterium]
MLEDIFTKLIGNAIVASGRSIKVHNIEMFAKNNFEITPEQYVILSVLNQDTLLHQSELCHKLYKDKSNMTRILSVLEKRGLIVKIRQTENKKPVNKIKITEKGKTLRDKISPYMEKSRKKYLNGISNDDMYVCIKVLSQIQENLIKRE